MVRRRTSLQERIAKLRQRLEQVRERAKESGNFSDLAQVMKLTFQIRELEGRNYYAHNRDRQ